MSVVPVPGGVAAHAVGDSERPGKCDILVLLPDQAGLRRGSGRQGWTTPSSQRVGSGFLARRDSLEPPLPFVSLTPAWLPAAGQIRKTCGVPAYLRVVIEKHRTQASRTMNAETAQAGTERVN